MLSRSSSSVATAELLTENLGFYLIREWFRRVTGRKDRAALVACAGDRLTDSTKWHRWRTIALFVVEFLGRHDQAQAFLLN